LIKLGRQNQEIAAQKPLRVLMVTGVYPTEQKPHAGTFVKSQVDSLIEAGLEVEVLHPAPGPAPVRYIKATIEIFRRALAGQFDIIHGHYGLWGVAARLQWFVPVVVSFWGDDLLGTVTSDGGHSKKSQGVVWISRKLCYLVDAIIVKSEQMKQAAGGPQDKIYVIPNGVNFAQFRPIPRAQARAILGWDRDRFYVLFSNNPKIPVKNFALAQAAIERLRERGLNAELVVANGLPHDTVVLYMNASNALLLSSVAEGSPNVVKEAMACNIPVVATNVGDVAKVIGRTEGCSVCDHNAESLAEGLEKALRHSKPTTGREDIQHLGSAVVAQQVINVYKKVLGKNVEEEKAGSITEQTKEATYAKET
jgi:teichuronic acid biosynthesis glycosyltransferase TuaC